MNLRAAAAADDDEGGLYLFLYHCLFGNGTETAPNSERRSLLVDLARLLSFVLRATGHSAPATLTRMSTPSLERRL